MLVYELIEIISKVSLPRFSVKQLVAPLQLIFVVEKNAEVNLSRRVRFVVSLKRLVANNPGAGVVDYYSAELLPMKSVCPSAGAALTARAATAPLAPGRLSTTTG